MTSDRAISLIQERFGLPAAGEGRYLIVEQVPAPRWQEFFSFARETLGCRFFSFLTAVDWKEQGLEVVCRVENLEGGVGITAKARLDAEARCPSLAGLYRGADWMERECYDLLGVVFDGHPDLRRILLGQDWDGHPLRKDYAHDMPHAPYR